MQDGVEPRAAIPVEDYPETVKKREEECELLKDGDPKADDSAVEKMVREVTGNHTKQMSDIQRTPMNWNCQRIAKEGDITDAWHRMFVLLADWAMSIPEFSSLPQPDQTLLFRQNFMTIGWFHFAYKCCSKGHVNLGIPIGNGSYIPYHEEQQAGMDAKSKSTYGVMGQEVINRVVSRMANTKLDETEYCLMKTHELFRADNPASLSAADITGGQLENIRDAFKAYQVRFPGRNRKNRNWKAALFYPALVEITKIKDKEPPLTHKVSVEAVLSRIPFFRPDSAPGAPISPRNSPRKDGLRGKSEDALQGKRTR